MDIGVVSKYDIKPICVKLPEIGEFLWYTGTLRRRKLQPR